MQKTILTEAGKYEISTQWDSIKQLIIMNLKVHSTDWKKCNNIQADLVENDYPFTLECLVLLGNEELFVFDGKTELDFSSVYIILRIIGMDNKELYNGKIDSTGKFYHDISFYFQLDRGGL